MRPFHGLVVYRKDDIDFFKFYKRRVFLRRLVDGRFVVCRKGKPFPVIGMERCVELFGSEESLDGWTEIRLRYE